MGSIGIHKFDILILHPNYNWKNGILAISNGLVLIVHVIIYNKFSHLSMYNPKRKECTKLPQPLISLYLYYTYHIACDFLEHDLLSKSFMILLAFNQSIYKSSYYK